MTTMEIVKNWLHLLCLNCQQTEEFFNHMWKDVQASKEIFKEISYYIEHKDFLGKYAIKGYTVLDILVWQIDHFKSHMDRGEYAYQSNPEYMVLMAFHTFLEMEKDPDPYLLALQSETGTDYAEKY